MSIERNRVFISYSREDVEWLHRLQVHLKPLARDGIIEIWDDTRIAPGSDWRNEIEQALESALAAVLLVSADFLASDFIATDELPNLLAAARTRGTTILPVIVSPCRFTKLDTLARFQPVNDPATPLVDLTRGQQEAIFVKVADNIEAAFEARRVRSELHTVGVRLDETITRTAELFLLTMSGPMLENLRKLDTPAGFGVYEMSEGLRRELYHLRDIGYIEVGSIRGIPRNGTQLSDFVHVTETGKRFLELREAIANEARRNGRQ